MTPAPIRDHHFRRAVKWVALLNLAYFGVEVVVALHIGSVSLLADSADFFEDAAVNFLIFMALAWSATQRARVGMALAGVLLLPALAFLWALWSKLGAPTAPDPIKLTLTGAGALSTWPAPSPWRAFDATPAVWPKRPFSQHAMTCWRMWRSSPQAA